MTTEQKHQLVDEFLTAFPRESLKELSLEQYTNLNRSDSFCYWVEFKLNDIGSIRGNSAYKFGIYQYNAKPEQTNHNFLIDSKYAWKASLGNTCEKAFSKIKETIIQIVHFAQELNFDEIEKIKELAPMVKWKIAFLYSNNQIIPYYSIERLQSIANEMGMENSTTATLSDLQKFLKSKQGNLDIHEYGAQLHNIWTKLNENQTTKDNGKNPISTEPMTKKHQKYIDLLKEAKNLVLTGAPGTGKTFMAQSIAEEMGAEVKFVQFHPSYDYTDFVEGLRPVDNGNGQIGFERKDGVFKEFCKVAIKNIADSEKSVENLTKELSWQDKLEQFVEDAMENEKKFKTINGSEFSIADMKGHTIVVHNEQNEKTTDVAVNADEILDLLTQEVELKIVRDIRNHYDRKVQTQPDSYAFVLVKEIRAMKSKVAVATADKVEKKPFILIIDEINRGEASKIFGELFYAIDPGYRGKTNVLVQTQYQNLVPESDIFAKGFYVPENVYILATMNDIDRSVESMDFAMRRRFTWQEIKPEDTQEMLDSLSCAAEAKDTMNRLNKVIADTDGLGAAYMIGPSYFKKLKENGENFDKLWTMNIEPLLKEYLRGFRDAPETLKRFEAAYKENGTTDASKSEDDDDNADR